MTPPENPNSERPDEPATDYLGFERRPLLKALGVGAALSMGGGVASAEYKDDEARIDSHYGLPAPDAESIPDDIEPDHEVELHTVLPESLKDPDHPPFFHFEPSGIHVESYDIVQFTLRAPDHTITAYHPALGFQQRVPNGVPPFSSPVLNIGGTWLYQFEEEGVYDLYCGPHHVLGMNMRIVVGDVGEGDVPDYVDTFEGSQDPLLLAPFSKEFLEHELNATSEENEDCEWSWLTPQEVLSADALDPATIQSEGTVSFDAVLADVERFADVQLDHDG